MAVRCWPLWREFCPLLGVLVVFSVSFVFSVSPSGVCSVVSSRSGRRLSGGAVAVVARAVLAPVRLRSSVLRGACRSLRSLRSRVRPAVPFAVVRASVWVCASLLGVRAFPSLSVALRPVSVPSAGEAFAACRASLLAGVCRVRRVVAPAVPVASPLPAWCASSPLSGVLPPLSPLSPASSGGSLLSLSLPAFRSAVAAGRCPLRLSLGSFSWPLRSAVLWSLFAVLGSGRVAFVVGGGAFRAPALSFLVAGLRSLGFRSFAPSLVGSVAWRAAALRFLVVRCGVAVPSSVSSLSGRVSLAGLSAVFPALSSALSVLAVRSSSRVSCPPALRPALSCCLLRLFLALFPPSGC